MSVTQLKLDANRANAQNSTGPRTPEGKARSAQNARTNGFFARDVIVSDDERPVFDELVQKLRAELVPCGETENLVFGRVIHAAWNLHRVEAAEARLFDGVADPFTNTAIAPQVDRLNLYKGRFERALYRAMSELAKLQTNRAMQVLVVPVAEIDEHSPLENTRALLAVRRAAEPTGPTDPLDEAMAGFLFAPVPGEGARCHEVDADAAGPGVPAAA